ncbi:MAG: hypothetical protein IPG89_19245 [Bacteroidetes bacterium]|nr:hypothetical protein [Bacteroidota bacterium]
MGNIALQINVTNGISVSNTNGQTLKIDNNNKLVTSAAIRQPVILTLAHQSPI